MIFVTPAHPLNILDHSTSSIRMERHSQSIQVPQPFRPLFLPVCLPGNQSGSASTEAKNWCNADLSGWPPPTLVTLSAIQGRLPSPPCTSLLAARRPKAKACCQGQRRPSGAVSQYARKVCWSIAHTGGGGPHNTSWCLSHAANILKIEAPAALRDN